MRLQGQYLRRLLADRVQKPDSWDWMSYPNEQSTSDLIGRFQGWFRETSQKYAGTIGSDGSAHLEFFRSVTRCNEVGSDYVAQQFYKVWAGREQYDAVGRFLHHLPVRDTGRPTVLDVGCGPGT
ncbi:MAG: hypothetical protein WBE26_12675 [Phycisphaerae bacterium]